MNMNLIDRYLEAVKEHLPNDEKNSRDDIIAELKDSLLSRVEEREETLGRPLTDAELQTLVKDNGHPLQVASRYMPQAHVIGPSVYPFWLMAMRAMLIVVGIVYAVLAGISLTSDGNVVRAIIQTANGFLGMALFWAAIITLVFYLLEQNQVRLGYFEQWQPERLLKNIGGVRIERSDSLFDIVLGAMFLAWWTGAISFPTTFWHYGKPLSFEMSTSWNPYWWGILILNVWWLLLSISTFAWPHIKWDRLLLRILLNVISLALLYFLAQIDVLVVVRDGVEEISRSAQAQTQLNTSLRVSFAILAVIWIYDTYVDVRRLLQLRASQTGAASTQASA
jgi:hypothetical protein